jgi:hypothetical protein
MGVGGIGGAEVEVQVIKSSFLRKTITCDHGMGQGPSGYPKESFSA